VFRARGGKGFEKIRREFGPDGETRRILRILRKELAKLPASVRNDLPWVLGGAAGAIKSFVRSITSSAAFHATNFAADFGRQDKTLLEDPPEPMTKTTTTAQPPGNAELMKRLRADFTGFAARGWDTLLNLRSYNPETQICPLGGGQGQSEC
jgi:hypothetical protein